MTTVKIAFRGDIRRVSVTDYESLRKHITTAYGIENFVIKYIDEDDDRISVGSTFELADALRNFEAKGKILKLLVFVPKQTPDEPDQLINKLEQQLLQIQQRVTQRKEEAAKVDAGIVEQEEVKSKEEHESKAEIPVSSSSSAEPSAPLAHHVDCLVCSKPILGVLYRCSVCPGVNLCAACEELNSHDADHTLIKVRVPQAQAQAGIRQRQPRGGRKWCRGKFKAVKRAAFPLIALFVLRTLPFFLAILALWAAGQYAKKRRHLLSECAECSHSEACQIGKAAKRAKKCKSFGDKRTRIMCKIFFVVGCLLARAMPLWLVLPPLLMAMWCRRKLCQLRKGMCGDFGDNISPFHRMKENLQNFVRVCNDMDRALWTQLCNLCQNPFPVQAAVARAANALGEGPLSSGADGIQIPVAVPPSGPAFQRQTRLLQEMGFQSTPQLQQLLRKHNGNLQAVITELMQVNKEKQS